MNFQRPQCENRIKVTLQSCIFSGNIIYPMWLSHEASQPIELLINDDQTIVDIREHAFSGLIFAQLGILKLVNMRVSHLKRHVFNGLTSLHTLHIDGMHLVAIDVDILQSLPQLTSISFEAIGDEPLDIRNLTGTTMMATVQIVSLRENNFQHQINGDSFSGLVSARSLFLTNSNLQSIGANAFAAMLNSVQMIDLRENCLKSLSGNLLDGIIQRAGVSLYLSQNPWNCDCAPDIERLRNNLRQYSTAFADLIYLKCALPIDKAGKQLNETDVCNQDIINLKCQQIGSISIKKRMHLLSVRHSRETNRLIIEMDQVNSDLMLLIFQKPMNATGVSMTMAGAATATSWENLKLTMKLRINSTQNQYVFCALNRRQIDAASPLDCIPYHVRKSSAYQPPNNITSLICFVIGICLVTFLVSIFVGSLLGLSMWPKRSEVVSRSLHRRNSEISTRSAGSYASARIPSPFQQIGWLMNNGIDSTPPISNESSDLPTVRDTANDSDKISAPPLPKRPSTDSCR